MARLLFHSSLAVRHSTVLTRTRLKLDHTSTPARTVGGRRFALFSGPGSCADPGVATGQHHYLHQHAEADFPVSERDAHLMAIAKRRALVLDSGYRPIDIVNWQRAICLDLFDKVDVLEYYENPCIRSAREQWYIPAVLRVRFYVQRQKGSTKMPLSRRNVLIRDKFICQYCDKPGGSSLTVDHVVPFSKGGKWAWENLVTACPKCNSKKGDKSLKQLGWKLKKQPTAPSPYELGILMGIDVTEASKTPKEWSEYLMPLLEKMEEVRVNAAAPVSATC